LCVKLVTHQNYTKIHFQKNIKLPDIITTHLRPKYEIVHCLNVFHGFSFYVLIELGMVKVKCIYINLLNPTGHVMHHQFNIQQLYALPTLYLCVLYLSEKKLRLVPLTA